MIKSKQNFWLEISSDICLTKYIGYKFNIINWNSHYRLFFQSDFIDFHLIMKSSVIYSLFFNDNILIPFKKI